MQPRPITAILFGILNIGFGAFGALGTIFSGLLTQAASKIGPHGNAAATAISTETTSSLMTVVSWLTALAGVALIVAGVGLIRCQNWARLTSLGWAGLYTVLTLIALPTSIAVTEKLEASFQLPAATAHIAALAATAFGTAFNLAYPVLLVIFLTRPKFIAACQMQPSPANPT